MCKTVKEINHFIIYLCLLLTVSSTKFTGCTKIVQEKKKL